MPPPTPAQLWRDVALRWERYLASDRVDLDHIWLAARTAGLAFAESRRLAEAARSAS